MAVALLSRLTFSASIFLVLIGGTTVPPFLSFAYYHGDPCVPDPMEPTLRPTAWTEDVYDGRINSRKSLQKLDPTRSVGYLEVGGKLFRVCAPMTRLREQRPNGTIIPNIPYDRFIVGRHTEVKFIFSEKARMNVANYVTLTSPQIAETFPARPVDLIVSTTAGTFSDLIARTYASAVEKFTGQRIVVKNIPGAAGMVAAQAIKEASPDGYSLLLSTDAISINFYTMDVKINYWDFEPICMHTSTPFIIITSVKTPWKTFIDVLDRAKKDPAAIKAGVIAGSTGHFFLATVERRLGRPLWSYTDLAGGERQTALLGGHIDLTYEDLGAIERLRTNPNIRLLAVSSDRRLEQIREIPTLKELGIDVPYSIHRGLLSPRGTPRNVVQRWGSICGTVVKDPSFSEQAPIRGAAINFLDPKRYIQFLMESDNIHKEIALQLKFRR